MNRRDFLKCSLGMALGAVLGCGDSNEHHGSLFIRPYEEFQKIVEERKLGTLEQTANELEGFRLTAGFSGKDGENIESYRYFLHGQRKILWNAFSRRYRQ